jgi:hypothetical protein
MREDRLIGQKLAQVYYRLPKVHRKSLLCRMRIERKQQAPSLQEKPEWTSISAVLEGRTAVAHDSRSAGYPGAAAVSFFASASSSFAGC